MLTSNFTGRKNANLSRIAKKKIMAIVTNKLLLKEEFKIY